MGSTVVHGGDGPLGGIGKECLPALGCTEPATPVTLTPEETDERYGVPVS
jgi:hypothetical protein